MGLTVHYTLKSDCPTAYQARRLLGKLRQKALDLPVESVSEIRRLRGVIPEWNDGIEHDPLWFDCVGLVQRGPWAYNVLPKHALAFTVRLGDGCENASFGLLFGDQVESAIAAFPNFEHLEARGRRE